MIRGKAVIAAVLFPLLLVVTAYALLVSHHGISGRRVVAEFVNAGLLAPGNDVRIGGADVGTVATVKLTGHGTAQVTMDIDKRAAVHADATASVRPQDLLGSVYLALAPGRSSAPLRRAIPVGRTFVGTSAQDLFDTFDQPTRHALQALLVQVGTALDARGADLNQAVLHLAPVLSEVERVSGQVSSQDANLERLVVSTSALTGQLAPRTRDIERLISGLDATLRTTADRSARLDQALRLMPATLGQTKATLAELDAAARAATPLARQVQAVAPQLTTAVASIGPFAAAAGPALRRLDPVLTTAADALSAGHTGLPRFAAAVRELQAIAPPLVRLTKILDQPTSPGKTLVNWTVQGIASGLGGLAAEPGANGHHFMRGTIVLGCEMFGVAVRPGCLADLLQNRVDRSHQATAAPRPSRRGPAPAPVAAPSAGGTHSPTPPAIATVTKPLGRPLQKLLDVLGGDGRTQGSPAPPSGPSGSDNAAALLDYLLGR